MSSESQSVGYRRALEALRSGVPNADAVRVLGSNQEEVERVFMERLATVEDALTQESQVPGLLIKGDFGTGKSHLLEYLEDKALSNNFVCSRIVISKETPLFDPAKVYRAATESAVVPDVRGPAIQAIALGLRQNTPSYAELYRWANHDDSGVGELFPATLLLHERLNNEPELVEEITNFWSGDKLAIARVRQGLRQIGQAAAFSIKAIPARQLALQRFTFAPRLMLGAGYRGWVLLIDEVELIGRYSAMQRGKSYAELARWMGRVEGAQYPGLVSVATITDDFEMRVLDAKHDRDEVGPRLR
ncbi:MAG: BREX system ATP-binding domain-containing protein, partial [Dehalococcoidia bacterium]